MMIAVVAPTAVPHAVGGAERLCDGLVAALNDSSHTAELVTLPSPERSYRELIDSYESFAELDLSRFDLVVSTKYPSWMVRHPAHVVYMLHTLRGLYDTYRYFGQPTEVSTNEEPVRRMLAALQRTPPGTKHGWRRVIDGARAAVDLLGDDHPAFVFPGALTRAVVHWLDRDALHPINVRRHVAISKTVATRARYFPPGVTVHAVLPPTNLVGLHDGEYRSFFTASRLDGPKRVELLIEAMDHVTAPVNLRIAGTGPDEERLKAVRPTDPRIEFLGRIDEQQLVDEYANALAVPFVPLDEDFGLVTLEAQLAAKPVVTCHDSGGVTELVVDGVSGFVVAPDPAAIGAALNTLAREPARARHMGEAGRRSARRVTWERVVNALVAPLESRNDAPSLRASGRPRLVVVSTYPAQPARGGGQIRLNRLVRGLAKRFDVEVISLDDAGGQPGVTGICDGVRQTVISRSEEHLSFEGALSLRAPIPIGDIAATLFIARTPDFIDTLRQAAKSAIGVVLEQPYLLPALRVASASARFVYESQNAEVEMKAALLRESTHAAELLAVVEAVERGAVRGAELITTCSHEDRRSLERLEPTLAEWQLVPNGTDVRQTPFTSGPERTRLRDDWLSTFAAVGGGRFRRCAVFVASYHPPNLEAAETIVAHAHHLPNVAFVLVGSQGLHFTNWNLPRNVIVAGAVAWSELRRMLAAADVALNPMQSGGGTNLKLVEYFAAGVPVVSTPLGCRGVDVKDGRELLLAEPGEFPAAIERVLTDAWAAESRARAARALAEDRYDWATIGANFTDSVWDVLDHDQAHAPA